MKRCVGSTPRSMIRELQCLGNNLRDARERKGDSIETMAERCFATPKIVERAECGDPRVSVGVYASLLFMLSMQGQIEKVGRHWRTEAQARELVEEIRALVLREPPPPDEAASAASNKETG